MNIQRYEAETKLECDECGKLTKIIYQIFGDVTGNEEGFCLCLCRRCLGMARLKLEKALDQFNHARKLNIKMRRMYRMVDNSMKPTET